MPRICHGLIRLQSIGDLAVRLRLFIRQSAAIDTVHHIRAGPASVCHDIGVWDAERVRHACVVGPEVVKAKTGQIKTLLELTEMIVQSVGVSGEEKPVCIADHGREIIVNIDRPVRFRGLGHWADHILLLFGNDDRLIDREHIAIQIGSSQSAYLTAPETVAGQTIRYLIARSLDGVKNGLNVLLGGRIRLIAGLLRESGMQDKGRTVNAEHGGNKAVHIAHGFGAVRRGVVVDLFLHDNRSHIDQQTFFYSGRKSPKDRAVSRYGRRREDIVLQVDIGKARVRERADILYGGILRLDPLHDQLLRLVLRRFKRDGDAVSLAVICLTDPVRTGF